MDTNYEKAALWFGRGLRIAAGGSLLGAFAGFAAVSADLKNPTDVQYLGGLLLGAFYGAAILGVIPGVVTAWFLFLHMTGQFSQASRRRKPARRRTQRRPH